MAVLNPNSTGYFHSYEPNTNDLTLAMDYNDAGQPVLRTIATLNSSTTTGHNNDRYNTDAWGRQKASLDYSVFSATFTYGVPQRTWEEWDFDGTTWVPQPVFTHVDEINKMLRVQSSTVNTLGNTVATKTHPKYQPNRGHLYSTAVLCPNSSAKGARRWGLGTPVDSVYFEMEGDGTTWDLFVGRRAYGDTELRVSVKDKVLELFPNFDPAYGNVYDIQYQWRGVGNYYFMINLQVVYAEEMLGTRTRLSVSDPALAPFYSAYCREDGTNVELLAGCVDVSSEGGRPNRTQFGSHSTQGGLATLGSATEDTAILAVKIPRLINGEYNSRGAELDKLITWTRNEALTTVWIYRDINVPNLDSLAWMNYPESTVQVIDGSFTDPLNVAFQLDKANGTQVLSEWSDIDVKNVITNESKNSAFELTPGDIIVFTVRSIGAANVKSSAAIYFSELI